MSKIRFNLAIVLFHALLLLPILLCFFFILFHCYTLEHVSFFCTLELLCMAAGAALILILPTDEISFRELWAPTFLSTTTYLVLALILGFTSVELLISQHSPISGWPMYDLGTLSYSMIPQHCYYLPTAAGFALAGGLCAILTYFFPKLSQFRNKLFWVSLSFANLFLPTILAFSFLSFHIYHYFG